MLKFIFIFTLLFPLLSFSEEIDKSEVKIPLAKYLQLIEREKSDPITVVEEALLKGDYRNSSFQLSFKGRAVAPWKKTAVLSTFDGHLRNCVGTAILSLEGSSYMLTPQKSDYQLTCKLSPKNKNLELSVLNALYFESQVANAESNIADENTQARRVTLFEKAKENENRKHADVIAKAHYKLSILPDNSKFEYQFELNNPNRASEKYTIHWANNEFLENLGTTLKYEETTNGVEILLPSGRYTVVARGKINGQSFKPLLASEEQYLLIQSHPLMQVQPTTNWRRIATTESAISQDYNSARAFLIDPKESLAWSAKKLEVFSALGYTLKNAHYLYYIGRDGKAIVEASYQISNQGTPEIALDVPGKTLYMELDGQTNPLYRDDKNNLLVNMSSGEHNLIVQYQPEGKDRFLASFESSNLLKPPAVLSASSMTLRYDPAWRLIVSRFSDSINTQLRLSDFVWAALIGFLFFWILKNFYSLQEKNIYYGVPATLALLSLVSPFYYSFMMLTAFGLSLWRFRKTIMTYFKKASQMQFSLRKLIFVGLGTFALIWICGVITSVVLRNDRSMNAPAYVARQKAIGQLSEESDGREDKASPDSGASGGGPMGSMVQNFKAKSEGSASLLGASAPVQDLAKNGDNYEGLPAKIEIPNTGNEFYFSSSLLGADKKLSMNSFFIKNYMFLLWEGVLVLALASIFYRYRKLVSEALLKN